MIGDDDRRLTTHALVFAAGVKYGIQALPEYATSRFKSLLQDPELDIDLAVSDIAEAAVTVYTTTAPSVNSLRGLVVGCLLDPSLQLLRIPCVCNAVKPVPDLMWDLLHHLQEHVFTSGVTAWREHSLCIECGKPAERSCPGCGQEEGGCMCLPECGCYNCTSA